MTHPTLPNPTPSRPASNAEVIRRGLLRLRAAARRRLVGQALTALGASLITAAAALGLIDYLLRLPQELRVALWVAGVLTALSAVRRWVVPALRFAPSLTDVALRVEKTPSAKRAGLHGLLASALELPQGGSVGHPGLTERAVAAAERLFAQVDTREALLTTARAQRSTILLLTSLTPVLALALTFPALVRIGALRTLIPWRDIAWPKRAGVVDTTAHAAHALGSALPLRALLISNSARPDALSSGKTDVVVRYRLLTGETPGDTTRALLTAQGRRSASDDTPAGELYERLLEPESLLTGVPPERRADGSLALEYWFETSDDRTPPARIRLVDPPAVTAVALDCTPPAYAGAAPANFVSGTQELGPGRARTPAVGPVLADSLVTLRLTLSKPLLDQSPGEKRTPTEAIGLSALPAGASVEGDGTAWTVRFAARASARITALPVDRFGIPAVEESNLIIDVAADRAPTAAIVEPAQDEAVLATALVPVTAEGRDDVGLASVRLEAQKASPPTDSAGAPAQPVGEVALLTNVTPESPSPLPVRTQTEADVSAFGLKPGDELWLTAVATDTYEVESRRHEPTRSTPRKLRIITEAQLVEQILTELQPLRSAAMRLDQDQAQVAQQSSALAKAQGDKSQAAQNAERQAALADRLTPAADLLKRARERAQRNALADQSLSGLIKEASESVESAAKAAREAQRKAEQLAKTPQGKPADEALAGSLAKDQSKVREEMARVAELLSRGQDGWAARQQVDRLLQDQKRVTEATKALSAQTAGKKASELSPQEKAKLEQVASQQADLAKRAGEAQRSLAEKAQKLAPTDPAQSDAMKRAQQRAQEGQLREQMEQAAKQAQENRTGESQQSQEQAEKTLTQMLKDLDEASKRRDESLRRVLADLVRTIDALIRQQGGELAKLNAAAESGVLKGLDAGMIELHRNTLGALQSSQVSSVKPVLERLEAAAERQARAVVDLRDAGDALEAGKNERESLRRLEEAKELAQELDKKADQRQTAQQRAELKAKYAALLDSQVKVTADTGPFLNKTLGRREVNAVKGLGAREEEIRAELEKVKQGAAELGESASFDFAHQRLEGELKALVEEMSSGKASASVPRRQATTERTLRALVDALGDAAKEDPFRQQNEAGDEGGGGQNGGGQQKEPLIPPVAQLKVLRALQAEAAERTRAAGENPGADDVEAIASLQKTLSEMGQKILESMQKKPGEKPPGVPEVKPGGGPAEKPGEKPGDRPGDRPGAGPGGAGKEGDR